MKQHVEQLQRLWQLQELEQKILHQERELQNMASVKEYQQKKKDYLSLQEKLKKENEKLASAKKEQRRQELELQTTLDQLKKLQHKLYSGEISNIKELEGLERKIQAGQKVKSDLEDAILNSMESIERDEEKILSWQKHLLKSGALLQQLKGKARGDMASAQERLGALKERQEEFRQKIDVYLLKKYTEMSRHQGGRCISLVQQGFCGICNVSLPSSFRARMLTPGQFVFCENCGCLLVPGDQ